MARHIAQPGHGNAAAQTSPGEPRVLWVFLVCVVSALHMGCPSTISYQPNDGMVDTLGVPQAQQLLKDTLLRAVNPRVDEVEVTDAFVRYHLAGTSYEVRMNFKEVQRAEIFPNNVVLIWSGAPRLQAPAPYAAPFTEPRMLARTLLANSQDAATFADLMLSFARRAHGSTW